MDNAILLITSKYCEQCQKFASEWESFVKMHQGKRKLLNDVPLYTIIYDEFAPDAKETRMTIGHYINEGKDGYPLLLFYVNGNRHKPYWFNTPTFRTAISIFYAAFVAFNIGLNLITVTAVHRDKIFKFFKKIDPKRIFSSEEIKTLIEYEAGFKKYSPNVLYCIVNFDNIASSLQSKFDTHFDEKIRNHKNYPKFEKLLGLLFLS